MRRRAGLWAHEGNSLLEASTMSLHAPGVGTGAQVPSIPEATIRWSVLENPTEPVHHVPREFGLLTTTAHARLPEFPGTRKSAGGRGP